MIHAGQAGVEGDLAQSKGVACQAKSDITSRDLRSFAAVEVQGPQGLNFPDHTD